MNPVLRTLGWIIALGLLGWLFYAGWRDTPVVGENGFVYRNFVIWLGALATLALYSILYKENPIYRYAEHIFLGLATGFGLYQVWKEVIYKYWWQEMVAGRWIWVLALIAGLMYYTIYSRRFSWMSRVVMLTMMGLTAGLEFRKFFGQWMPQIGSSFKPLIVIRPAMNPDKSPIPGTFDLAWTLFASFTNILFVVCLVAVLTYFFFSFEQRSRTVRGTAATGRYLMMVAFGAMFGSTVMARMSLFIGRLMYLFQEWVHLIPK
jgi:hypothetical protein